MLSWNTTPMLARSESSVTSRISTPSMRMVPASGSRRRWSRATAVGQADPLELDPSLHLVESHGIRLLDDRRRRVQHGEKLGEPRRVKEQAVDEAQTHGGAGPKPGCPGQERADLPE